MESLRAPIRVSTRMMDAPFYVVQIEIEEGDQAVLSSS